MAEEFGIGIDLGTTMSCVAVYRLESGICEALENEIGQKTTPSVVSFNENERLVGEAARNDTSNAVNTVHDAKRLIGRHYDDPSTQTDISHLTVKVEKSEAGQPVFVVNYLNKVEKISPEEISSMVLGKMKTIAETKLNKKITKAVITVPAYFNDAQREATKQAGVIAGLDVQRIINEPTAAAIAFYMGKPETPPERVMIYDFGGGTLDVSLVHIHDGIFDVLGVSGDTRLGGEDINNLLVNHCVKVFATKKKKDIGNNAKARARLRKACEEAKKALSFALQTEISLDGLYDGEDFKVTLTRAKLEEICSALFLRAIEPIKKVLEDTGIDKSAVDEVVMVGGSTRIPRVKELVSTFFGGKTLNFSVNPDEAIALGAAYQAGQLNTNFEGKGGNKGPGADGGGEKGAGGGARARRLKDFKLNDVTPISLGIRADEDDRMAFMIKANTPLPVEVTEPFSTFQDSQTNVTVEVYQGENEFVGGNSLLGSFHLDGIAPAKAGEPKILVTFSIDREGILSVTAVDNQRNKSETLKISGDKGRFNKAELERLAQKEKERAKRDEHVNKVRKCKAELHDLVLMIKRKLQERRDNNTYGPELDPLSKKLEETDEWIENNDLPKLTEVQEMLASVRTAAMPWRLLDA